MERLDVARLPGVVLKRLAKLSDTGCEGPVTDDGLRPHRAEYLVLRDDLTRSLEQEAQQGERFALELHLLLAAPETAPGVQPVVTESK